MFLGGSTKDTQVIQSPPQRSQEINTKDDDEFDMSASQQASNTTSSPSDMSDEIDQDNKKPTSFEDDVIDVLIEREKNQDIR